MRPILKISDAEVSSAIGYLDSDNRRAQIMAAIRYLDPDLQRRWRIYRRISLHPGRRFKLVLAITSSVLIVFATAFRYAPALLRLLS